MGEKRGDWLVEITPESEVGNGRGDGVFNWFVELISECEMGNRGGEKKLVGRGGGK